MLNLWLNRYARWLELQYELARFVAPPSPPLAPPPVSEPSTRPLPPTAAPKETPTRPQLRIVVRNMAIVLALLPGAACTVADAGRVQLAAQECYTADQLLVAMQKVAQHPLIIGVVDVRNDFISHYAFFVSELTSNWTLFEVKQRNRACVVARGIYWGPFPRNQE